MLQALKHINWPVIAVLYGIYLASFFLTRRILADYASKLVMPVSIAAVASLILSAIIVCFYIIRSSSSVWEKSIVVLCAVAILFVSYIAPYGLLYGSEARTGFWELISLVAGIAVILSGLFFIGDK